MGSSFIDQMLGDFNPPESCDVAVSHIVMGNVNDLSLILTPAEVCGPASHALPPHALEQQ
jgi:hypothetical protein